MKHPPWIQESALSRQRAAQRRQKRVSTLSIVVISIIGFLIILTLATSHGLGLI